MNIALIDIQPHTPELAAKSTADKTLSEGFSVVLQQLSPDPAAGRYQTVAGEQPITKMNPYDTTEMVQQQALAPLPIGLSPTMEGNPELALQPLIPLEMNIDEALQKTPGYESIPLAERVHLSTLKPGESSPGEIDSLLMESPRAVTPIAAYQPLAQPAGEQDVLIQQSIERWNRGTELPIAGNQLPQESLQGQMPSSEPIAMKTPAREIRTSTELEQFEPRLDSLVAAATQNASEQPVTVAGLNTRSGERRLDNPLLSADELHSLPTAAVLEAKSPQLTPGRPLAGLAASIDPRARQALNLQGSADPVDDSADAAPHIVSGAVRAAIPGLSAIHEIAVAGQTSTVFVSESDNFILNSGTQLNPQQLSLQTAVNHATITPQLSPGLPGQPPATLELEPLSLLQTRTSSELGNGLGDRVSWMVNQKLNSAVVRLDPPSLGRLDIQIQLSDDAATITINTQHAQTRELIDAASARLRDMLQENGFSNVNVDVSHKQGQQQAQSEISNPADDGLAGQADDDDEASRFVNNRPTGLADDNALVDYFA